MNNSGGVSPQKIKFDQKDFAMSFVTMGPMLKRAQAGGYGIAAFNMIDYNSARAVVEAAAELDAPMIVQVSTKTIKHWGFKPIGSWVRMLAEGVSVPVALMQAGHR
jgi:fructose/tagatose bisphosphate aldolase